MAKSDQTRTRSSAILFLGLTVGVVVTFVGFIQAAGADPSIVWAYVLFAGLAILAVTLLIGIALFVANLRKLIRSGATEAFEVRLRMLLVVFGGVVVLAGAVAWSVGSPVGDSGLDPELITEIDGDTVRIYESNEHGPVDNERRPVQSLVFEGSQAEADAFMSEPQSEDRNYLVPALIIAVGAVIVIVALIRYPRTKSTPNPSEHDNPKTPRP